MKDFTKRKIKWNLRKNQFKVCLKKKFKAIKIYAFNDQADYFSYIR